MQQKTNRIVKQTQVKGINANNVSRVMQAGEPKCRKQQGTGTGENSYLFPDSGQAGEGKLNRQPCNTRS